ncbi:MAG: hypothetical protein L0Y50_13635 [Beijerinckiaceae bacterium]|nr:hypothetical protein [Beijerinckiaceae bacterium]MCI0737288.1 hypothetical protein [Beijerinckiaceae bacterium]
MASVLSKVFEPVAAELRLVNAADYIAYIHQEKFANIQDIVNSSSELLFQPGTLTFGWGADFDLDWNSLPVILLDMEFRHRTVWLAFKLILDAQQTKITVDYLSSGQPTVGQKEDFALLMEALGDARLNSQSH